MLEVLVSCMFQDVHSLIERINIQSNALIINQCDVNRHEYLEIINKKGIQCKVRIIHTTERGLSRSRNMAIYNAIGDICLFCDDDEVLEDDYVEQITTSFHQYSQENIILFRVKRPDMNYSSKTYRVGLFRAGRFGSVQIAFKRCSIVKASIRFCEKMGSGTGNGGGEDNKFIVDCLRKKIKIRYVPVLIGSVSQIQSQWFHGYDRTYWINQGWTSKMVYGFILGYIHIWHMLIFRCPNIDVSHPWYNHFIWLHKGFFYNR